jgi:transcriptional regulator with XRE-family HTH domain
MYLNDYMAERGLKDEHVAAGTGYSRVSISRYRRGLIVPSWGAIEAIKKFTRGAVTETDWAALAKRRAA